MTSMQFNKLLRHGRTGADTLSKSQAALDGEMTRLEVKLAKAQSLLMNLEKRYEAIEKTPPRPASNSPALRKA
jgi:hypothetical protein